MAECELSVIRVLGFGFYKPYVTSSREKADEMAQACTEEKGKLAVVSGDGPYEVLWKDCEVGRKYAKSKYRAADVCVQDLNTMSGKDSFALYYDTNGRNGWRVVRR